MKVSGGNRLYDELLNYVTQVLNWRKASDVRKTAHLLMQG